jgi:hypothetical protein
MGRIAAALDYAPFLDVLGLAEVLGVGLQRVQGLLGELAIRGFIEGHGYSNRPELGNARITAAGYERLDDLLGVSASPSMTAVSREVLSYLDGDDFRSRFPSAARSWEHASNLLAGPEPNSGMIGYACREAMQAFAGELVELHRVADPPPRTSVTLSIQAVAIREHVGKSKSEFYAALVKYWSSVYDLSQRQAKNAVREGEELTPDDARRVVFQTAVVMHELAQVPIAEERG